MKRFLSTCLSLLIGLPMLAPVPGFASSKKDKDVEQIGNRDVGKGLNWYSLEKEMAGHRPGSQAFAEAI